jgi:hypothetical protein
MIWGLGFFVVLPLIVIATSGPLGLVLLFIGYALGIVIIRGINRGPSKVTSSDWTQMPETGRVRKERSKPETELLDDDEEE